MKRERYLQLAMALAESRLDRLGDNADSDLAEQYMLDGACARCPVRDQCLVTEHSSFSCTDMLEHWMRGYIGDERKA